MIRDCGGQVLLEKEGRQVIRCEKCGYNHIYPFYSEEELEKFYENVYAESTPSFLWHEKVHNIKRWKRPGTVLDIGCWEGTQLQCFKREGWQCTGTEINKRAAAIAASKGMDIHQISIREFFPRFEGRKWDVINAAYILEHILDPADFLRRLKHYLAPDGIMIIEVPNEFSPFQMAYIKERQIDPYWIALPDHVNYFDRPGMENLLQKTGFKIIRGETSFPMEMFLLMGDNYLEVPEVGKRSFGKVVEMERILRSHDLELVTDFYASLYGCSVGRSLVLYVQENDNP